MNIAKFDPEQSAMMSVGSDHIVRLWHAGRFKLQIFLCQTCCYDTFHSV